MPIYVTNSDGQRFKVTGTGGGGIDEIPIATETAVGGIKSSSESGKVNVSSSGIATVNDNVTMEDSGVITLNGVGNSTGSHTIEFNNDPEPADVIGYDNSTSGLTATDVQSAIDEVQGNVMTLGTNTDTKIESLESAVQQNTVSFNYIQNLLRYYSKENILDNWYFKSPINQFGKGSYTNDGENVPTFDRWVTSGSATVSYVVNSHIHVSFPSNDYSTWGQYIPFAFRYAGKAITISCYCKQSSGTTKLISSNNVVQLSNDAIPSDWGLVTVSYTCPENMPSFFVGFQNQTQPSEIDVMYMKVEVNHQSTFMHKEGNIWKLNDTPPNDAEMLIRCARYLQVFGIENRYMDIGTYFAYNESDNVSTTIQLSIPLITKMSSNPSAYVNRGYRLLGSTSEGDIIVRGLVDSDFYTKVVGIECGPSVCNIYGTIKRSVLTVNPIALNGQVDNGSNELNYIALASAVE